MKYYEVVLSKYEQKLFNRFKRRDRAYFKREEYRILLDKELVKGTLGGETDWFHDFPEDGEAIISELGRDVRSYQVLKRTESHVANAQFWIGLLAPLVVSIASLVLSFYNLFR